MTYTQKNDLRRLYKCYKQFHNLPSDEGLMKAISMSGWSGGVDNAIILLKKYYNC